MSDPSADACDYASAGPAGARPVIRIICLSFFVDVVTVVEESNALGEKHHAGTCRVWEEKSPTLCECVYMCIYIS